MERSCEVGPGITPLFRGEEAQAAWGQTAVRGGAETPTQSSPLTSMPPTRELLDWPGPSITG